jgi:hypothetical protein
LEKISWKNSKIFKLKQTEKEYNSKKSVLTLTIVLWTVELSSINAIIFFASISCSKVSISISRLANNTAWISLVKNNLKMNVVINQIDINKREWFTFKYKDPKNNPKFREYFSWVHIISHPVRWVIQNSQ